MYGQTLASSKPKNDLMSAQVLRGRMLLGLLVAELGAGAQADAPAARRADDLLGDVEAERADDLAAGGAEVMQLLDPKAVDLAHHEVEVAHALGTVLLGQERVPVHLADGAEQGVVLGQVEAQLLPHRAVVDDASSLMDPSLVPCPIGEPGDEKRCASLA